MLETINKDNKCWTKEKAWKWYGKQDFILGVNYLPRTSINTTEFWQAETFDILTIKEELGWAKEIGYNSVRVFLQFIVWENDKTGFNQRFNKFLELAKENNIKVTPVLFDDCAFSNLEPYLGRQNEPTHLVHNSGWTPSPGVNFTSDLGKYSRLKEYVIDIVTRYSNDDRVLMWDLYNEPGNSERGAKSLYLVEKSFEWARSCNPVQPLTTCMWGLENGAAVKDTYFVDLKVLELSDVITYHHYGNEEQMNLTLDYLSKLEYPVICTEWMARVFFDCHVNSILPIFDKRQIGSYHWGLVNGKTQTHIPWNWDVTKGEPEVWFHDVLAPDGTPYDKKETDMFKYYSKKNNRRKL